MSLPEPTLARHFPGRPGETFSATASPACCTGRTVRSASRYPRRVEGTTVPEPLLLAYPRTGPEVTLTVFV